MSDLHQRVEDYIAVRRALGSKLERRAQLLHNFVAYLEAAGASSVTTELALAWATLPGEDAHPTYLSNRLCAVRGFARHLQAFDPATEVPPARLLPWPKCRAVPYLYSDADIAALMKAARSLTPALRAATYECLIGVLSVTGMRVGEALRLDRDDVGWDEGVLTIWDSKFGRSREVPLHPSSIDAAQGLREAARRAVPRPHDGELVRLRGRCPARLCHRAEDLCPPCRRRRARPTVARAPAAPARHEAHAGLQGASRLVSRRRRRRGAAAAAVHLLGARQSEWHVLVSERHTRAARPGRRSARSAPGGAGMNALAPTLEAFFTERLIGQRHASTNTIAAYRDAWRLLLRFVRDRTGKEPSQLELADLDATVIGEFLDHLENERHNSARTRNARLAAIRSFFHYAALRHPEHAGLIARVLAIPTKRCQRTEVSYLTTPELDALVDAPDPSTWTGRRDHALLDVAAKTGLRVSELTGLRNRDIELGSGANVRCTGKGRKDRATPLPKQTVAVLKVWMRERRRARRSTVPRRGAPRSVVAPSPTSSPSTPPTPSDDARRFGPSTRRHTSFATAAQWNCCAPRSTSR